MGIETHIEWTDHTFNPWIGCTKVSEECRHCYAETEQEERFGRAEWGKGKPRYLTQDWKTPVTWNLQAHDRGVRARVFCASLADFFDAEVNASWRENAWQLIRQTEFLDWLLLTKRPENIPAMLPPDWGTEGWDNVCLMTTVGVQDTVHRVPTLLEVPARYYGLSVEPLIGPVEIDSELLKDLDWIIVGGESSRDVRPMKPQWARNIRDGCAEAGVPFFFKQWGCWSPGLDHAKEDRTNVCVFRGDQPVYLKDMEVEDRNRTLEEAHSDDVMSLTDKATAGSHLDGRQYKEHPFHQPIPSESKLHKVSLEKLPGQKKARAMLMETLKRTQSIMGASRAKST